MKRKIAKIMSLVMNNTFLPDGSCQGLEVSDAKSIYMASGANNEKNGFLNSILQEA